MVFNELCQRQQPHQLMIRQSNNQKVLVLADWDNTQCAAKSFNRKLEWTQLRNYLANPQEGRELIEMVIYVGLPPDRERFQEQRKGREKFVYWARSNGFLVTTHDGKAKGDGYEADVDVIMAMDAIELALEIRPDIVVLVTGDSDFAYLANKLRHRGIRVEVASVAQALGNDLKNSANSIVDLVEVFDGLQPQNANQEYHPIGHASVFD
jgi:uncharacterized LabA/DUF88 family protein